MADGNITCFAYLRVDVSDNDATNNALPPDAVLADTEDAQPEGMPDAPPPSPQLEGGSNDGGGSDGENLDDWVLVTDENLLQRTLDEKGRLHVLIERLRIELFGLKQNNRTFARENSSLKVDIKELEDEYDELNEQFVGLMFEYQSVVAANDREIRALKASIDQKNRSIDAILKDFQFTLD